MTGSPLVEEAKKLAKEYIELGGESSPADSQKFRKMYARA